MSARRHTAVPPVNTKTENIWSELPYAAAAGDLAWVQAELASGVDVDGPNKSWKTPLMLAAGEPRAKIAILETLVDAGADVNAVEDQLGTTPLRAAARAGNVDKVRFLLSKGASAGFRNKDGYNAIIDAVASAGPEPARSCAATRRGRRRHQRRHEIQ